MKRLDTVLLDQREKHNFYRALAALKHDGNFASVRAVFEKFLGSIDEENRSADGIQLHRNQGAALLVQSFLESVRDAETHAIKTAAK